MNLRTAAVAAALAIFGLGAAVGSGLAANSISYDSIVPTVRLMLRIGVSIETFSPRSSAGRASSIRRLSSAFSRPWLWLSLWRTATPVGIFGIWNTREKSRPFAFQCSMPFFMSSNSVRPMRSSIFLIPS